MNPNNWNSGLDWKRWVFYRRMAQQWRWILSDTWKSMWRSVLSVNEIGINSCFERKRMNERAGLELTTMRLPYSVKSVISNVRSSDDNLSAQNRNAFLSMHTFSWMSLRKPAGDSWITCWTRRRVLMYSMRRFRKLKKWSALRMLPGTAPFRTSSGRTGLAKNRSASRASLASRSPFTIFWYSSCNRFEFSSFALQQNYKIKRTKSVTLIHRHRHCKVNLTPLEHQII